MRVRSALRSLVRRIWPSKPKPLILTYHRIADEPIDPWGLAVSPTHFKEQLHVLRRTRHPLPLADFVRDLMAGTLRSDAVSLTFDDGYVDNLSAGMPSLTAADIPATVFLVTGYLDRSGELWWDELARLVLRESRPQSFELVVRGKPIHFNLGNEFTAHKDGANCTDRLAALSAIWTAIRCLEDEERELIMVELRSIFAARDDHSCPLSRAMTSKEVQALVTDGLVTIGAHTVTHPELSGLKATACHREILESKLACEALIGAPVTAFAYPYGDFDANAREAVKTAGFTFACSTRHEPVVATSDVFALPRIHVSNWDGDAFERAIRSA